MISEDIFAQLYLLGNWIDLDKTWQSGSISSRVTLQDFCTNSSSRVVLNGALKIRIFSRIRRIVLVTSSSLIFSKIGTNTEVTVRMNHIWKLKFFLSGIQGSLSSKQQN